MTNKPDFQYCEAEDIPRVKYDPYAKRLPCIYCNAYTEAKLSNRFSVWQIILMVVTLFVPVLFFVTIPLLFITWSKEFKCKVCNRFYLSWGQAQYDNGRFTR